MGVYLSNIEMPRTHPITVEIYPNGTVLSKTVGRMDIHGTAAPVTPHGDLIDRREAIIDANERAYDFWLSDDEVNATIRFLNEQTTIIKAEDNNAIP